jgi:hypothetical protein
VEREPAAGRGRPGRYRPSRVHVGDREGERVEATEGVRPPGELPEGPRVAPRVVCKDVQREVPSDDRERLGEQVGGVGIPSRGERLEHLDRVGEDDRHEETILGSPDVTESLFLLSGPPGMPLVPGSDVRREVVLEARRDRPPIAELAHRVATHPLVPGKPSLDQCEGRTRVADRQRAPRDRGRHQRLIECDEMRRDAYLPPEMLPRRFRRKGPGVSHESARSAIPR